MTRTHKHENREDLAGEHSLGDIGQLILLVIFLLIWILDSFVFKYSVFVCGDIPSYVQVPAVVVALLVSGFLSFSGLKTIFGKDRKKDCVVRAGVFSVVRHPIYLGSILLYLGLSLSTLSLFSLMWWVVIVVFYYLISRYEEKLLVEKFGQEYEVYKKEVPMLLPIKLS